MSKAARLATRFRRLVEGRHRQTHWRGGGPGAQCSTVGRKVIGVRSRMSSGGGAVNARDSEAGGREGTGEQQLGAAVVEENGENGSKQNGRGSETADVTHGFNRPEMLSESLVGSVSYYERHVFLCCKDPEAWPADVASAEFDRLPNLLAGALQARKNAMPKKTRLTVCEGGDGPDSSTGDVLIFPDMVRYRGLTHEDADTFVEEALVNGKNWTGSMESLSGSYVFVCSHGSRDQRCGTCGPVLIEKLHEEIKLRGLESQVFVRACSHVGGHKYAGNVIVFSSSGTDGVEGHWYGYVSPADVAQILDVHIERGQIIDRLWRGQMGVNGGDQKLAQEKRLGQLQDDAERDSCAGCQTPDHGADRVKNCSGSGCGPSSDSDLKEKRPIPDYLLKAGSSAHDGHLIFYDDDSDTDETSVDPRIPLWGPYYIPLPKWVKTWEKEDTNALLAVVVAAAAVTIAVRICRESLSE